MQIGELSFTEMCLTGKDSRLFTSCLVDTPLYQDSSLTECKTMGMKMVPCANSGISLTFSVGGQSVFTSRQNVLN